MKSSCLHLPLAVSLWCATFLAPSALHADCCGGGGSSGSRSYAPSSAARLGSAGQVSLSIDFPGADGAAQVVLMTVPPPGGVPRAASEPIVLKNGARSYTTTVKACADGERITSVVQTPGNPPTPYTGTDPTIAPKEKPKTCPLPITTEATPEPKEPATKTSGTPHTYNGSGSTPPGSGHPEIPGAAGSAADGGGGSSHTMGHTYPVTSSGGFTSTGLSNPDLLFRASLGDSKQRLTSFGIVGGPQPPATGTDKILNVKDFEGAGENGDSPTQFTTQNTVVSGTTVVRQFLVPDGLAIITQATANTKVKVSFYKGQTAFAAVTTAGVLTEPATPADQTTTIERLAAQDAPAANSLFEAASNPSWALGWMTTVAYPGTAATPARPSRITKNWSAHSQTTGQPDRVTVLTEEYFDATHKRFTLEINARETTPSLSNDRKVTTKQWIVDGGTTQLLFRDQETYKKFDWGESVVQQVLDSNALACTGATAQTQTASNRTTSWEYWSDATDGPDYGQPKYQANWDGSWSIWYSQLAAATSSTPAITTSITLGPWKNCAAPASLARSAIAALVATPSVSLRKDVVTEAGSVTTNESYAVTAGGSTWTQIGKTVNTITGTDEEGRITDVYASASELARTTVWSDGSSKTTTTTRQQVFVGTTGEYVYFTGMTKTLYGTAENSSSSPGFIPSAHYDPRNRALPLRFAETRSFDNYVDGTQQTRFLLDQTLSYAEDGRPYIRRKIIDNNGATTPVESRYYAYDARKRPVSVSLGTNMIVESWSYPDESTTSHTDEDGVTRITKTDVFGRTVEERIVGCAAEAWAYDTTGLPAQPDVVTTYDYSTARAGGAAGCLVTKSVKAVTSAGATVTFNGRAQTRPLSEDEYDGNGVLVRHKDSTTGRTDYFGTTAGSSTGGKTDETRLGAANGTVVSTTLYFQDGRVASKLDYMAAGQTTGKYYDYAVEYAFHVSDSTSATAPASLGAATTPSLTTLTTRDGLGRTIWISQPSATFNASTGAATPATEGLSYYYDEQGRLAWRQVPGAGSGDTFEYFEYSFDTGGQYSVVTTCRVDDSWDPGASWSRRKRGLMYDTGTGADFQNTWCQWEQEEAPGPGPAFDWTVSKVRKSPFGTSFSGPMLSLSCVLERRGAATTKSERLRGVTAVYSGTTLTGYDLHQPSESRKSRNGIVTESTLYYNGLPTIFSSPAFAACILAHTPLREPLAEPSFTSSVWSTLSYVVPPSEILSGRITSRVSPGGATESFTYYAGDVVQAGQLSSKTTSGSPSGITYYDYNGLRQLTRQWGTGDYPVEYAYDNQARLSTMTTWQTGSFSGASWPASPSGGATTTWAYATAALPWVLSKTDAAGKAVSYTYHSGGALKRRKWARGVTTNYYYDGWARLYSIDYSDSTPDVTFAYDPAGRVSQRVDGTGTHNFTWRADGQLEQESTTGGLCAGQVIDPGYNDDPDDGGFGQRSQFSVSWGTTATAAPIFYDYTNLLLTHVTAGSPASREVALSYTGGSATPTAFDYFVSTSSTPQLTRTWSGSASQAYSITYTAPKPPGQTGTAILASLGYTYDGSGRVTDATRENSNQWHYEYDTRSQVAKARKRYAAASDSEILAGTQAEYAYDLIGNRSSWKWGGNGTNGNGLRTTSYTADSINRYTALTNPQTYDVTGRRAGTNSVAVIQNGTSTTLPGSAFQSGSSGSYFWKELTHDSNKGRYDAVTVTDAGIPSEDGNQYIPAPTTSPTYDDDGNLLTDGRWTYVWDAENRLTSMTCPSQVANTPTGAIRHLA